MTLENISDIMPAITVNIGDKTTELTPTADNKIQIIMTDGQEIAVTIENTGLDNQAEDLMYIIRYYKDGNAVDGRHVCASQVRLIDCLSLILTNFQKNGVEIQGVRS